MKITGLFAAAAVGLSILAGCDAGPPKDTVEFELTGSTVPMKVTTSVNDEQLMYTAETFPWTATTKVDPPQNGAGMFAIPRDPGAWRDSKDIVTCTIKINGVERHKYTTPPGGGVACGVSSDKGLW